MNLSFFAALSPLLLSSVIAAPCDIAFGLALNETYSGFEKLSVFGFSASVRYMYSASASEPTLRILAASENPSFSNEDGTLSISTSSCRGSTTAPASSPPTSGLSPTTSLPEDSSTSSAIMLGTTSFLTGLMGRRSWYSSLLLLFICSSGSTIVHAQNATVGCTPTLHVEITMPADAVATEKYGETDHYLAANVSTVTWGYYDISKVAQVAMQSGETITVEVITHHAGHDYAKMIRGDTAVEEVFAWPNGTSQLEKPLPKMNGTGVHIITGPIAVDGAEVGDVVQIDILELDPRPNTDGRTFGTNSQKFAGYPYRLNTTRDGRPYVKTGGTEAITVFEFIQDDNGNMLFADPVYMYRFPNMTLPDGSTLTYDSNPSVTVPHIRNQGYDGELLEPDPIEYAEGYDGFSVTDAGGIVYLSPDPASLEWRAPLRPHLGVLAVMPNNTENYIDMDASGGANSIPPSRFGGNVDDWRIGKGGTMYYKVEVPGAQILAGDTHAAQGDSELAGTAMETSMTAKLRVTLHKADSLPATVATIDFPLLETSTEYVIHGFAYSNYLDELADPSAIFNVGASLDDAFRDCYVKTRNWLMDVYDLIEEESIALMTTSVNFGVTQVVDGNWGAHAIIEKWVLSDSDAPYDYSCTTSKSPGRRTTALSPDDRRRLLDFHGVSNSFDEHAEQTFRRVLKHSGGVTASRRRLGARMLDAKLKFVRKLMLQSGLQW